MASQINVTSIDSSYPIMGQDNPSQGFRNNFTAMKNNFSYAYTEISALQRDAVMKAVAGAPQTNDMTSVTLTSAEVRDFRETTVDQGIIAVDGALALNYPSGAFHIVTVSANITSLSVTNWPTSGKHGRMRVLLNVTGNYVVTLATGHTWANASSILSLATGVYLLEFSTKDAGDNIYVVDLFRKTTNTVNYSVANLSANSNVSVSSSVGFMVFDTLNGAALSTGANITLPANSVLSDGQRLTLSSNVSITNANVRAGANTTIRGGLINSTWSANTGNSWVYQAATTTWFRN
jgi:hypothetical protein